MPYNLRMVWTLTRVNHQKKKKKKKGGISVTGEFNSTFSF